MVALNNMFSCLSVCLQNRLIFIMYSYVQMIDIDVKYILFIACEARIPASNTATDVVTN